MTRATLRAELAPLACGCTPYTQTRCPTAVRLRAAHAAACREWQERQAAYIDGGCQRDADYQRMRDAERAMVGARDAHDEHLYPPEAAAEHTPRGEHDRIRRMDAADALADARGEGWDL